VSRWAGHTSPGGALPLLLSRWAGRTPPDGALPLLLSRWAGHGAHDGALLALPLPLLAIAETG
jgi:hypothetical protein